MDLCFELERERIASHTLFDAERETKTRWNGQNDGQNARNDDADANDES